jgi:paraquat-inducible protein B
VSFIFEAATQYTPSLTHLAPSHTIPPFFVIMNNKDKEHLVHAAAGAGELAAQAKNAVADLSEKHHVKQQLLSLKQQGMEKYAEMTGRNASLDGTIVKFSTVAAVGAAAVSIVPAVAVGAAVGGALLATVKANADTLQAQVAQNYEAIVGRDAAADGAKLQGATNKMMETGREMGQTFASAFKAKDQGKPLI